MTESKRHGLRYGFGEFHLDPERRLLFGSGGQAIPLKPKVFDTLLFFVEHAGELLEKEALMKGVWGNVIVEENSLNQHISTLRRALGETPGENRFIVTVPGRGYRFVAPVTSQPADVSRAATVESVDHAPTDGEVALVLPVARPLRRRVFAFIVVLATCSGLAIAWRGHWPGERAAPPQKRVAVLPFQNLSPDPDNQQYASAIHDEVINELMKIGGLDVTPRTSVMAYLGHPKPIAEIARELNVGAVMEGSFQRANNHAWIKLKLIEAETERLLWQQEYDRKFDDIFGIESDIALNVAQALRATLSAHEIDAVTEVPTLNARAHDWYLAAKDQERRGIYAWPAAIEHYEKAITEDSNYALAFAELAIRSVGVSRTTDPSPKRMDRAKEAANSAVELKPELAEGRIALAEWQYFSGSVGAEQILRDLEAIERKSQRLPEFFDFRAGVYASVGRWQDALADQRQVVRLEPRNIPFLTAEANTLVVLRRYDEAEQLFNQALDIEPNDAGTMWHKASLSLFRDGDPSALRKRETKIFSDEEPVNFLNVMAAEYDGAHETTLKLLHRFEVLLSIAQPGSEDDLGVHLGLGVTQQRDGQTELALASFERARHAIERKLAKAADNEKCAYDTALAAALLGLGETGDAARAVREAAEKLPLAASGDVAELRLGLAQVYARMAQPKEAVAQLDEYLSHPGEWSIQALARDPDLKLIRDDPGFQDLLKKYPRH